MRGQLLAKAAMAVCFASAAAAADQSGELPEALRFCGPVNCYTYQYESPVYRATNLRGNPNAYSTLTVQQFTRDSIALHRVDTENGKTVFETDIVGQMSPAGNSLVNGGPFRLTWGTALHATDMSTPRPEALRFCGPVNCYTYKYENGVYRALQLPTGVASTLTVQSFTKDSIALHRVDTVKGKDVFSTDITGQISSTGDSLVNGGPFRLTWGAALNAEDMQKPPPQTLKLSRQDQAILDLLGGFLSPDASETTELENDERACRLGNHDACHSVQVIKDDLRSKGIEP
jgi:hypothetical protein